MTYRLLSNEYSRRFKVMFCSIQSLMLIQSASDFRKLLISLASDLNMDTNVIVKAYTKDVNGKKFFLNCLERRHCRVKDLLDEDMQSLLDEVMTMLLNSNEYLEFGIGSFIDVQFFCCKANGEFDILPEFRDMYNEMFP